MKRVTSPPTSTRWTSLALLALAALPARSEPPPGGTTVVSAQRMARPLRDVPESVTVIPREEIERNPGFSLDGLLRSDPSAQMFRRSSSLVADPSAQGLNLRG